MIKYVSHGFGSNYVLAIHDMASDHSEYLTLLPYLDLLNFTFIFPDLRGYGLSKDIPGEYTLSEVTSSKKP